MAVIVNGDGILTGISSLATSLTDITSGRGTVTGVATVGTLQLGAGVSISSPRSQQAAIFTNNTEFLTVDDAGRVGVGTITPNSDAHPENEKKINVGFITAKSIAGDIDARNVVVAGISTFQTGTFTGTAAQLELIGNEGVSAALRLTADQGDDNGDGWEIRSNQDDNDLTIKNNTSGSYVDKLTLKNNGDLHILDKIIHDGDTNTAIRFPAADTFTVETGGSERLRINSSGVLATGDFDSTTGIFERTTGFTSQIKFNSSNETQLIHGSNGQVLLSFVGTGNAARGYIDAQSGFIRIKTAQNETGIICRDNSSTDLHYNDSKKFETTDTGNQGTGILKLISGSGSQASDFSLLHLVAGGTADRGLKIGTGRATGANQNDGAVFYDAINSESNEYGSQHIFRRGGHNNMVIGYQSNNYVGIQQDAPGSALHVTDTNPVIGTFHRSNGSSSGDQARIALGALQNNPPYQRGVTLIAEYKNTGHDFIVACSANDSTGPVEALRVAKNGEVKVTSNNLKIGTNGYGIDFSATSDGAGTDSSELFDDYEEGTWTPTCNTGTLSYGHQSYTKIGRMVYINTYVNNFSNRTSSSAIEITGLPYNPANESDVGACVFYRIADTDEAQVAARTSTSSNAILFLVSSQGGSESWHHLTHSDLNHANSQIKFSIWYAVA